MELTEDVAPPTVETPPPLPAAVAVALLSTVEVVVTPL
jgi:hypothetical protein